jgi:hypothetical protein
MYWDNSVLSSKEFTIPAKIHVSNKTMTTHISKVYFPNYCFNSVLPQFQEFFSNISVIVLIVLLLATSSSKTTPALGTSFWAAPASGLTRSWKSLAPKHDQLLDITSP